MSFTGCVGDISFGPVVWGCRDGFDFTIKFEKIFLSLVPTSVFIAVSLPRLFYLVRRPVVVNGPEFRAVKLVSASRETKTFVPALLLTPSDPAHYCSLFSPPTSHTRLDLSRINQPPRSLHLFSRRECGGIVSHARVVSPGARPIVAAVDTSDVVFVPDDFIRCRPSTHSLARLDYQSRHHGHQNDHGHRCHQVMDCPSRIFP